MRAISTLLVLLVLPVAAQADPAPLTPLDTVIAVENAWGLLDAGKPKEALDAFRALVAAAPGDCWLHAHLSAAYLQAGNPTFALQEAARTLDSWRLVGVTLYCTLEPCPMCAGAMVAARLSRLVYGADDPKAGAAGSVVELLRDSRFNHQVAVTRGVLAEEALALMERFFASLREKATMEGSPSPAYGAALEMR